MPPPRHRGMRVHICMLVCGRTYVCTGEFVCVSRNPKSVPCVCTARAFTTELSLQPYFCSFVVVVYLFLNHCLIFLKQ